MNIDSRLLDCDSQMEVESNFNRVMNNSDRIEAKVDEKDDLPSDAEAGVYVRKATVTIGEDEEKTITYEWVREV